MKIKKKICLLVDSLSSGGAEKLAANSSKLLIDEGYEVFIVTMQNLVDYRYEGKLYNFGLIKKRNNPFIAFLRFRCFFKKQNFDWIIDHRTRSIYYKELLFSKIVFRGCNVLYYIHNYELSYSFSFLNFRNLAILPHVKNKKFVAVCVGIQKNLESKIRVKSEVVYNYIPDELYTYNSNENNYESYIIGVGRLTKVKQFDKLIKSYKYSKLQKKNIRLIILGDGNEKENLEVLISDLKLTSLVKLVPFKKNPYSLVKNAKALVMSSKFEGFPMVLLESLALNTPVIAFNCKSGPSEIIKTGVNGLLVKNQNQKQLTVAINKLILDDNVYRYIKKNARVGLEKFSERNFIQRLVSILENPI